VDLDLGEVAGGGGAEGEVRYPSWVAGGSALREEARGAGAGG